jgi:hypothetical protein
VDADLERRCDPAALNTLVRARADLLRFQRCASSWSIHVRSTGLASSRWG